MCQSWIRVPISVEASVILRIDIELLLWNVGTVPLLHTCRRSAASHLVSSPLLSLCIGSQSLCFTFKSPAMMISPSPSLMLHSKFVGNASNCVNLTLWGGVCNTNRSWPHLALAKQSPAQVPRLRLVHFRLKVQLRSLHYHLYSSACRILRCYWFHKGCILVHFTLLCRMISFPTSSAHVSAIETTVFSMTEL